MGLVEFSIRHRRLVNVCSFFLILAGVYALHRMPLEVFPNIPLDVVVVRADYPGAGAEQVERLIVEPIERELRTVDDIDEMASVATEGFGLTILEIDPNAAEKERVVDAIQGAIDRVPDLPRDLPDRPLVRDLKTRNNPIIEVALSEAVDSENLPEERLQELAKTLELQLLELPDVAAVTRRGWRERQIWVEVDPAQMSRYAISLADISAQLQRQNVMIPGGSTMAAAPAADELLLRTSGEFHTPAEVEAVVLRANDQGMPVTVRDLALVHWDFAEAGTLQRVNGARTIILVVVKKAGGNAIRLVDSVRQTTAAFAQGAPPNLQINYVNDLSFFIRRRLKVLAWNGGIGLFLVVLCILYFLSFRTALGAAFGIPVAALAALAAMGAAGASINLITVFGMIMVVGMLVDEDLVIAENIHRYLEQHDNPTHAVVHGTREIMRSVIATVLTTIAAFLPLLFLTGIIGKFIRWIPLVVIITLCCSLIEALWILPSHLYSLHMKGRTRAVATTREWRWFNAMRDGYLALLDRALRLRYATTACIGLGVIASIIVAVKCIPFSLFPPRGLEIFFIRAEAPIGTPLAETERRYLPLEHVIAQLPPEELQHYATQIGIAQNDPEDPHTNRGSHVGQVIVYLTPPNRRHRTLEEIVAALRPKLTAIPGLHQVTIDKLRPGPPVGKPLAIKVRGPDLDRLEDLAGQITAFLTAFPGAVDVRDDFERGKVEAAIAADPVTAARAGLTVAAVGRAIRAAYEGEVATTIRGVSEDHDVVVRLPPALRQDLDTLEALPIPNAAGRLIRLGAVATRTERPGAMTIKRLDGERAIMVTADVETAVTTPLRVEKALAPLVTTLRAENPQYTFTYGGEIERTGESLRSLQLALGLAGILILAILVATLDSYGDALIVLSTIPLGLVGVTIGFLLVGFPFSFMALLGMVGLTGVVVDSAILLIDFTRRRQRTGLPVRQALCESAAVRFRPIVLVTTTTVFGIIPSAIGLGGTDPFIQPMALALNWGLIFSTLFNLFWVPCCVLIVDDVKRRWGKG